MIYFIINSVINFIINLYNKYLFYYNIMYTQTFYNLHRTLTNERTRTVVTFISNNFEIF